MDNEKRRLKERVEWLESQVAFLEESLRRLRSDLIKVALVAGSK